MNLQILKKKSSKQIRKYQEGCFVNGFVIVRRVLRKKFLKRIRKSLQRNFLKVSPYLSQQIS